MSTKDLAIDRGRPALATKYREGWRRVTFSDLVHIAQYERCGGLEQWVRHYLFDRTNCPNFTIGSLEEEARRIAREIVRSRSIT